MRSPIAVPLILTLVVLVSARAGAQEPPPARRSLFGVQQSDSPTPPPAVVVRLDYAAAEGCPAEKELRDVVAARMGYDPFAAPGAPAPFLLRTAIVRQGAGFVATLELRDISGRVVWSRPPLAENDCRRLVSVLGGVTITIAIDTATAQAPAAPAPMPLFLQPSPSPALAPDRPAPSPWVWPRLRLGVRAAAAFGVGPAPTAALSVDVGVGWQLFSIAVEGRADIPTTGTVDMGVSARTSVLAASLVPCGHYGWFVGCGLVTAGVLRAEGVDVLHPASASGFYAAAGVRAGLEWPIVPAFALRVSGDVLANVHPLAAQVDFEAGRAQVWRSGPFAGFVGAGAVVRFGGP